MIPTEFSALHPRRQGSGGGALLFMGIGASALGGSWALLLAGNALATTYFYHFAWWPLILLVDGAVAWRSGSSLLTGRPKEFFWLLPWSSGFWFVFEAFNLRLQNWSYIGVPREVWIRWPGYAVAFATVLPGIFEVRDLVQTFRPPSPSSRHGESTTAADGRPPQRTVALGDRLGRPLQGAQGGGGRGLFVTLGLAMLVLPLVWPHYFFPLVWGGFVFLLDPFLPPEQSLLCQWRHRDFRQTQALLLAGLVCGGYWELCNFWAGAKWIYRIPFVGVWKVFEMPILGFLGFPPFALECAVFATWIRGRLAGLSPMSRRAAYAVLGLFMFTMCRAIDGQTVHSFR